MPFDRTSAGSLLTGSTVTAAGTGVVVAALGLIPGLFGGSLHATLVGVVVGHWLLAASMPFGVAAAVAWPLHRGRPDLLNGSGAAVRTGIIAIVGSLAAEGIFRTVTLYGGSTLTGRSVSTLQHSHPAPYTWPPSVAVVGLGVVAGLLLARSQARGIVQVRRGPR